MFYSSEQTLLDQQQTILHFFTKQVTKEYLNTAQGKLHYGFVIPEQAHTAIVISSGRIEGLDKYQELIWELYNNNFAVFIFDHQGQGRSYRALKNSHKGFVKQFSDYTQDLSLFDTEIVKQHWQGKKIILGHSMGGAIAFDYIARYSHDYSGAFLSAPMFDVYTKGIPKPIAKWITRVACFLGLNTLYAFGQGNYKPEEFTHNVLTGSKIRYQLFRQVYQHQPIIQLGGVTFGWLKAAFSFMYSLKQLKLSVPLFIASAELDTVVENHAQHSIAEQQKNATLETFSGAKHELLFETDPVRKALLRRLYAFCDSVS